MSFTLSERSLSKLVGVKPQLITIVKKAIQYSTVDFAVTEGVRTLARQKQLVAQGKSQTLDSKHLSGDAVDLVAYIGGDIAWELNLYDNIADAMKRAAQETNTSLRWGAAWHIEDIRKWSGSMEAAMNSYIDLRRKQGKRPFIDGPHFELS